MGQRDLGLSWSIMWSFAMGEPLGKCCDDWLLGMKWKCISESCSVSGLLRENYELDALLTSCLSVTVLLLAIIVRSRGSQREHITKHYSEI